MKKEDKRGLSAIITTLLVILITIVGLGITWVVIKNTVKGSSEEVSLGKFTIRLEIVSVKQTDEGLNITVQRNSGEGELEGIFFSIFDGEQSYIYEFKDITLDQLEKKTFEVDYFGDVESISLSPLIKSHSNKTIIGEVADTYYTTKEGYVQIACRPNCNGKDCGSDGCKGSCGSCNSEEECNAGKCEEINQATENRKDMNLYTNKEIFLISDNNWQDILQLVPLTTWTKQEGDGSTCQSGYETAENVCTYSTLLLHEESGTRPTDLATGASITNSSYDGKPEHIASNAIDGDILKEWNSGSNSPGYLKINLTQVEQINRIDIFQDTEPYFMNISVSLDDISYQDIVTNYVLTPGEGYSVVRNQIELTPIGAKYIKITLYDNPAQRIYPNWKTVSEVKIYGNQQFNYNTFDGDSIIYFMQQYNPNQLTIVDNTPQEFDNLLIASPEVGAGLNQNEIQRISVDDYLSYWESYKEVVYVEEDYELALIASTYASLLNAPLIVEGSTLDVNSVFNNKNIICVGNVPRSCNEQYTLNQLRQKYIQDTNTDKIIIANPNDLNIKLEEEFKPDKSTAKFYELYTKASLASPILASAKHEVIISTTSTDYQVIDDLINSTVYNFMPQIINNSQGVFEMYYDWGPGRDVTYYINGYLTFFGAHNAIPSRLFSYKNPFGGEQFYIALDQNRYGDIFLGDLLPDLSVGRIQGISTSDISSYIARDLFYDQISKTNNFQFMAKDFYYMAYRANAWTSLFNGIGYTATCNIKSGSGFTPPPGGCTENADISNWPTLWNNKDLITFMDHGGPYNAGISSSQIPYLLNSLVFIDACSTCSTYDQFSFCNTALRKGGIGITGSVSYGQEGDNTVRDTIEGIYTYNLTLGQAFSRAYTNYNYYMDTLIGDPTLDPNPTHILYGGFGW